MQTNVLYYGDNLKVLREHIPDESVDLIYLDPPFNSQQDYNLLFREATGQRSEAQIRAFTDSWHWDRVAEETYQDIVLHAPMKVAKAVEALREFIGPNDVMAYLVMMTVRLVELHRVLKSTGSLYLHCDPTASHYLKVILDTIFDPRNFRNEIIWRRSHPKGHATTRFARNHDVILAFAKNGGQGKWNPLYLSHNPERVAKQYPHVDETGRRYQLTSLLNPNTDRPNLTYEFKGVTKVWRWTKERMLEEDAKGQIVVPRGGRGIPRYKRYLDEQEGIPIDDFWADIDFAAGRERQGYQTQKPLALLERIISASSNPGDVVLDPFCGCGTAVVAAHKLDRRWIGIDVTHLAIAVMRQRLEDHFPGIQVEAVGEPEDVAGARALAHQDRYQFQWWALSRIGARPVEDRKKKGADKGVDGVIPFQDAPRGVMGRAIVQVKSGHVGVPAVRELKGILGEREVGVFVTLEPPTQPMVTEAVSAGFHRSEFWDRDIPKLQILTIDEVLGGKKPDVPRGGAVPYARAGRIAGESDRGAQLALGDDGPGQPPARPSRRRRSRA